MGHDGTPRPRRGRLKRRLLLGGAVAVALLVFAVFGLVPGVVEKLANRLGPAPRRPVSESTAALHRSLTIADLHADSLLWNRDLSKRGSRGHVDLPRLAEGNVALQVFSAVTRAPTGPDYQNGWDRCAPLVIAQRWPLRTWGSLVERALYQAERLQRLAERSDERLVLIRTAADLRRLLERRPETGQVGGLLAIEGLQAMEGDEANLERLFDAGYRMLGLVHFYDNAIGGSAHGGKRGGLTPLGRRVVGRMEELGTTVDLAHASERLIDDVLDVATRPVVFSHTGVRATCDTERNISDRHVRRVAENGGVIGIGYFKWTVCELDPTAVVRAIRHVADLVGVEHVALGSDWDGAVQVPFDAAGLVHLTQALVGAGFDETEIRKIAGGNVVRLLERSLPPA
jgi:microsomal dipeptidase-like Zn-dependent dipeptidase